MTTERRAIINYECASFGFAEKELDAMKETLEELELMNGLRQRVATCATELDIYLTRRHNKDGSISMADITKARENMLVLFVDKMRKGEVEQYRVA